MTKKMDLSNDEVAEKTLELFKILRHISGEFVCKHGFSSNVSQVVTLGAASELLAICAAFSEDEVLLDVMFACIRDRRKYYFKMINDMDMSNVYCFNHGKKR